MPEGYYSGDKPNPNLRAFVEQHIKERPYDPETNDYDVLAFDKAITTSKDNAIYGIHGYWSKKPYDAIRQYIKHFTKPNDLVLDPFCGSGTTAIASSAEGRQCIAIDLSGAATFITKHVSYPTPQERVIELLRLLRAKIDHDIQPLYTTTNDQTTPPSPNGYTIASGQDCMNRASSCTRRAGSTPTTCLRKPGST